MDALTNRKERRHDVQRRAVIRRAVNRRGMAPMEVVMTLGIVLPIAAVLYAIAQRSLGNLYHVVSILVAYPYL